MLCKEDEKIEKTRAQSTVKYLKNQLGEYYGVLYGDLSSEAHLELVEIGKYLRRAEDQIAVRDRSGKECERETVTLLKLLEGYCELVWKGMNQFGILEVEKEYYTDWHDTNMCTVEAMVAVLNDKAKFKSISNECVTQR